MQPKYFIYRQKGKTLTFVCEFHTISECIDYFMSHKDESLWYMDAWGKTMEHNSHWR